jgi:hypothetical protein
MPIEELDQRRNIATWAVPCWAVPAVAGVMVEVLDPEPYDAQFMGQYLQTTYFDTQSQALRQARLPKQRYITLRLRAYGMSQGAGRDYQVQEYALTAKTSEGKFRQEVSPAVAKQLLADPTPELLGQILPPDLFAILLDLVGDEDLWPCVTVCSQRYATEDAERRLTLDLCVRTDTGKELPYGVLEFKSTKTTDPPPGGLPTPGLRPIKMSKFLWATDWR